MPRVTRPNFRPGNNQAAWCWHAYPVVKVKTFYPPVSDEWINPIVTEDPHRSLSGSGIGGRLDNRFRPQKVPPDSQISTIGNSQEVGA